MKEQQEKIRVLDPHIILILFISAFVFGIGMLMIFLERKEIRTEGYEFIIFSVEILMLLLILYYMRTVVLSREGCTVSWLFWKRNYKWEELAVIREDVWYTYGKGGSIRYQGIVFSKYAVNKKKKKYTTRMIVDAFPLSDCFYITFDEHGNVFSYKLEKGKKQVIRKMYVNVREKMKEWGVEAEKGEGIKEEEKQRQYDEMIELRRQQRKKIQSKGADCTNLKEYQQEVIKIRDFLQITMVILITVLLIWTGLSAEEGERIPILILEFLINAPLLFFSSKVVTLSKEGCKISYLFFKKMYKWEELEIIREDYFPSFRDRRSRGIVFSKRKKNKAGYIYTTREIVGSGHILECFYIVLDADGNTVTGIDIMPTRVRVSVHMSEDQKTGNIPFKPIVKGEPAEGYKVSEITVTPPVATVKAPESYFDKNTVVELEEIDITGAKESVTKKIDIPKPENGMIIPGAVTVHVKIEKE